MRLKFINVVNVASGTAIIKGIERDIRKSKESKIVLQPLDRQKNVIRAYIFNWPAEMENVHNS